MSEYSRPLQELPCPSPPDTASQPKRGNKRKWRSSHVSEGLDAECTPTELISGQCVLHTAHTPICTKGKENDCDRFFLARRPRKRKDTESDTTWERLPDELLLRIMFYLPLHHLLRTATVCKRWHRLALDESLWHSVDLDGLSISGPALQQVLKTGVRRLRCPRSFVEEQTFKGISSLQIVHIDLSSSVIPTTALENIISHCRLLECISLEGLPLSDAIIDSLAMNPNILELNLSGCSCFSATSVCDMLGSLPRLTQLNISWCDFSQNHVKGVIDNLCTSVTHLNLSGYRQHLSLADVKLLVQNCPNIQTLDLSDSALLTADSLPVLSQLKSLQHLSLSRCYLIHPAALLDCTAAFPALRLLEVFGLVNETQLPAMKKGMPHISINSRPFSTTARPTPATSVVNHDNTLWNQTCRLRVIL